MTYAGKEAPETADTAENSVVVPRPRRIRPPPPPVVSAALSGLVVGIILTLLVTGTMSPHSTVPPPATLPAGQSLSDTQMRARLDKIVSRQLGPGYPDARAARLVSLNLSRVRLPNVAVPQPGSGYEFRSVDIVYRLNDHPLGPGWRLRAARADVFEVLKALYTSKLPVYSVYMQGLFPRKSGKSVGEQTAVEVYIDYHTAAAIPWKKWGRESENRLWNTLTLRYVAPWFA